MRRFRDLHADFAALGAEVIGASVDNAEKNAQFKAQEELGYELVSDPGRELASELGILKDYGAGLELAARTTYLLDGDGTILRVWQVDDINRHADEVLAAAADFVGK